MGTIAWQLAGRVIRASQFLKEGRQQHPHNTREHRHALLARAGHKALYDAMRRLRRLIIRRGPCNGEPNHIVTVL